jgi:hypothetical protein
VTIEVGELIPVEFVGTSNDETWSTIHHTYVLIGARGAVHFVYGDWGPRATDEMKAIDTKFVIEFGHPLYPMGYDVGYHTPAPMTQVQVEMGPVRGGTPCDYLDGKACYGDGSGLRAQTFMERWLGAERDETVLWGMLARYYADVFHSEGKERGIEDLDFGETLVALGALLSEMSGEDND